MKFKGKIAVWWYAFIIILNAACLWVIFSKSTLWGIMGGAAVCITFNVLFIPTLFNNYVELSGKGLQITFGLSSQTIPYKDIRLVAASHNPMVSCAASLDRLYIAHAAGNVMIAVYDKEHFIKELQLYNNKIEYVAQ